MEIMLEGIIGGLTETPYPNLRQGMPPQNRALHKRQATIGWDQMLYGRWSEHWRILQQQHLYNNNTFKTTTSLATPETTTLAG
jgi:hypothetical protein